MSQKEFERIVSFLREKNAVFEVLSHEPVFTSKDAARVRGMSPSAGVKAILLKSDSGSFVLACLPGDKKIDTKKFAGLLGAGRLFLASAKEVLEITGCEIGSVSPFGAIFGIETLFDKQVFENEVVEFNAGLHTKSVRMKANELRRAVKPKILEFSI